MEKVWYCKIGAVSDSEVPDGGDGPMRNAVEAAYKELTGCEADFTFSGWGAELTELELAVHEDREPNLRVAMAETFGKLSGDVRQLLTAALAGNFPDQLSHLRYDTIWALAKADREAGVLHGPA